MNSPGNLVKRQERAGGSLCRQGVPGEYIFILVARSLSADNLYSTRQTRSKAGEQVVAIPMASPYVQMASIRLNSYTEMSCHRARITRSKNATQQGPTLSASQ